MFASSHAKAFFIASQLRIPYTLGFMVTIETQAIRIRHNTAPMRFTLFLAGLLFAASAQAACVTDRYGNPVCPPAGGQCIMDRHGEPVCSGPDGSVRIDRGGDVACGRGDCVMDIHGEIMCSTEPRGSVALDRYREAVCTGGCQKASAAYCVRPRR